MKTRYMNYTDYGMSNQKAKELKDKCMVLNVIEKDDLLDCCRNSNKSVAYELFYSLVYNISYDKLFFYTEVLMSKVDFYAYRRKALALFDKKLNQGRS